MDAETRNKIDDILTMQIEQTKSIASIRTYQMIHTERISALEEEQKINTEFRHKSKGALGFAYFIMTMLGALVSYKSLR